ncbi:MAG: hypothetical protein Q7T45_16335 [Bradyrhizobium sp.]|uniref:hypothetical protein n=1 Tax=Bradyrhizobium sp. TaxID=376 RepID=UPI002728675B|nr:hypothetical protein [Bradyrhizobium sp.]MDO8399381.1 hypothetical protein [Bradyrhizobium sp.]
MSFQITVLKVLAGHPDGHASVADLTHYVSILMSSGSDWTDRMKRLAASAPRLDIFSSAFVNRQMDGWRITNAGRQFLTQLEAPVRVTSDSEPPLRDDIGLAPLKPVPKLRLVVDNTRAVANSVDPDKLSA